MAIKKIFYLMLLSAFAVAFDGCSKDDDDCCDEMHHVSDGDFDPNVDSDMDCDCD